MLLLSVRVSVDVHVTIIVMLTSIDTLTEGLTFTFIDNSLLRGQYTIPDKSHGLRA